MSASSRKYMSKRQRPCDFCRSRKTACRIEGRLPCRLCALHGRDCTFVEAAQPRKRPTPSGSNETVTPRPSITQFNLDGNTSPNNLAFQFSAGRPASVSPENHDIPFSDPLAIHRQESLTSDASNEQILLEDLANQFFNEVEETVPDNQYGRPYPVVEEELSPDNFLDRVDMQDSSNPLTTRSVETQLDQNDDLYPQTLGYSGDMDPYLLQNYRYDLSGIFKFKQLSIQSVFQGSAPTQFLLSQPGLFSSSRQEMGLHHISFEVSREKLETLVSPDTGLRLISLFRRFILPQCPVFSDSLFPDPQSSPPYLLAAIYMIAQPFAKFDDVLSIELAYENLNTQALFKLVHDALQHEAHNPNISVVQSMILLVLRPSTNPLVLESSFKWSLHGALVATAQTLGLHHNPSSWNISPWQIALRRRISFTIFAMDKWLASSLGRPPLITRDAWLVTTLTTSDGFASSMSPDLWSDYVHYAALGPLLGDVLHELFSLRAINELASNVEKTLNIARGLLEQLTNWHQEFLNQSRDHSREAVSLPIICTLGFHYIQMTIFRAIIRPFIGNISSNGGTAGTGTQIPRDQPEVMGFARTGVRSSTAAAANFVKKLQEEHSHIFWPNWSQVAFSCICFLNLMMAISSPDTEEAVTWFRDLQIARKEMRFKSAMLPVLRLGLLRIDAIFWKGVDKVLHLRPHVEEALKISLESNLG